MPRYNTQLYTSVTQIPNTTFDALACTPSFYFSKAFLLAFEKGNSQITYNYIVFELKGKPIAIAVIQSMYVSLSNATESLPLSKKLAYSLQCYLSGRNVRITVCGNVFLSGAYGLWVTNNTHKRGVYLMLSQKIKELSKSNRARVLFLKDFDAIQDAAASVVEKEHFQSFAVEPNMILPITWDTFEDYKNSLRSKYRVKVNRADSKSNALVINTRTAKEIRDFKQDLQILYTNITEKALFNSLNIDIETYALLKEHFTENVHFYTYHIDDVLVGFMTAFKVGNTLDAHFIGVDYSYNKTNAIYPRMLNDYIRLGIDLEVKIINLGRTASEIKSTLGATPEHLRCYVKHRRTLANMLFKPFVKQIKMTEYKQHLPFKQ